MNIILSGYSLADKIFADNFCPKFIPNCDAKPLISPFESVPEDGKIFALEVYIGSSDKE